MEDNLLERSGIIFVIIMEMAAVSQVVSSAINSATSFAEERQDCEEGGRRVGWYQPSHTVAVGEEERLNSFQVVATTPSAPPPPSAGTDNRRRSFIARGATQVRKKPCRVLVFSAFVAMLMIFVYTVYILITHFSELFQSDVFWGNLKEIVMSQNVCKAE